MDQIHQVTSENPRPQRNLQLRGLGATRLGIHRPMVAVVGFENPLRDDPRSALRPRRTVESVFNTEITESEFLNCRAGVADPAS